MRKTDYMMHQLKSMSMAPPLIDPTKAETILQIVPCPPISTSDHLGWAGIQVQHHCPPAWENAEHSMNQHFVVVHHADQTAQAERTIDGRQQKEQLDNGQVVILPATVSHKVRWNRQGNFTVLMLDPLHLARTAYESVDSDRFELIPQFAMFDPLIYQIGLVLKAEVESGVNNRLYVDSLTTMLSAHLLQRYSVWKQILPSYQGGLPKHQLRLILDLIDTYLTEELSLETLAVALQMSPLRFMRLFKQSTGLTPHQYVQRQRVEKGKRFYRRSYSFGQKD
ncbi:helix-turn-helix transcriptional regulator [Oscillatoria sp. FACHB-1407]|uniref:AraC family transcriptional regulator n=1 Tax=Oscillatoria sp. FACHB-1407 TaxID=2692847 RepID=UPI00168A3E07|nr:AraC family transcriptional regulator [Oscillatoria sp. FACHB-1407]MBD2463526.1 helix-turn-helix transcriptional regulator [Oscillatoria sp. FACHB-1407]